MVSGTETSILLDAKHGKGRVTNSGKHSEYDSDCTFFNRIVGFYYKFYNIEEH